MAEIVSGSVPPAFGDALGRGVRQASGMPSATHATLATFLMDLSRDTEQREALERFIVPGVRQFPGFVSGHWTLDRATSESVVLLTYESLDAAEAMAENIRGNAANQADAGLALVGVRILEIAASA
jgi:hypothetical protein